MDGVDDSELAALAEVLLIVARRLNLRRSDLSTVIPLTGTEIEVIRAVHRHPGLSPTDIATRTGLQRSNVSTAVRVLEAKGLVRRESVDSDGRAVVLRTTEAAAENLENVRQVWAERLRPAGDDALADVASLRARLQVIAERLEAAEAAVSPIPAEPAVS